MLTPLNSIELHPILDFAYADGRSVVTAAGPV
jgi:hypothetical protein